MTSLRDPHESGARLAAYAAREADQRFLASLNRAIETMPPVEEEGASAALPLLFIVGAPRSGTTLLSQLVAKYLEVGYINNLIARFWSRPGAGIELSRIVLGDGARRSISLRSIHGTTHDVVGPHEFGYFWRRWFCLDDATTHHLSADELARVDRAGLRRVLRAEILGGFRSPVAFKNVICGFQARLLADVHPASLFVHITRDPIATACSILESRVARYGRPDAWWSLKPAAFPAIERAVSPAEQVALQVLHCRREIDEEVSGLPSLTMTYEGLCADPDAELGRVCDAMAPLGAGLRPLGPVEPLAVSRRAAVEELRTAVTAAFAAVGDHS